MTYLISQPTQFLHLKGVRNHMDSASQPTLSEKSAKSIFASKTFWGAALTAVAAIAPIVGHAVKQQKLTHPGVQM